MADAIPTPPGQEPVLQSTILAQKQRDVLWEALKEAGWWTPTDWMFVILIALIWVTTAYWKLFGHPAPTQIIAMLLVAILAKFVWLIVLVFRCSHFVLRLHSVIATMPEASARIAVAYLSGKK